MKEKEKSQMWTDNFEPDPDHTCGYCEDGSQKKCPFDQQIQSCNTCRYYNFIGWGNCKLGYWSGSGCESWKINLNL